MSVGFRSPLFIFGISTTAAPAGETGYLTPIPIPGMGTEVSVAEYGFITPIPIPGMGTTEFIPPDPEPTRRGGGGSFRDYDRARILREDEEILALIMAYTLH